MGTYEVLDPYSKLGSEWGCLAFRYMNEGKKDSVKWALEEGKRRGGFSPFYLAEARALLDGCSKNAILMSSGDAYTFSMLYVQQVENYRTDVSVVDVSLIHTTWYPSMLVRQKFVSFSLPSAILDTIEELMWEDKQISIPYRNTGVSIEWTVKPTCKGKYLSRGNRVFLDLLQTNRFERDVFMAAGMLDEDIIGLEPRMQYFGLLHQLVPVNEPHDSYVSLGNALKAVRLANPDRRDETNELMALRAHAIHMIYYMAKDGNEEQAKELLITLGQQIPESRLPYDTKEIKDYVQQLRLNFGL
jgi:hypothetical protein